MNRLNWAWVTGMVLVFSLGTAGLPAAAQEDIQPLRVEEAVIGTLSSTESTAVYSVEVVGNLRMAVTFDVIAGDMQPSVVVLDQDRETVLAGATGPNTNGVIVEFPTQGTYYVGLTAESGTSATFRLMINGAPALPINPFVAQSFLVDGTSTLCIENVIAGRLSPNADLNVCFAMELIDQPVEFKAEWWTPSGDMVNEEGGTLDSSDNGKLYLTGIIYEGTPWETGWWQVHLLLDGELAKIQWVLVE